MKLPRRNFLHLAAAAAVLTAGRESGSLSSADSDDHRASRCWRDNWCYHPPAGRDFRTGGLPSGHAADMTVMLYYGLTISH